MRRTALLLLALALPAHAGWTWSDALTVGSVQGPAIFPHLESANRQNVAVSGDSVGVAWEDNRDGSPQCYLAIKAGPADAFAPEIRLSQSECYEPVVLALGEGRFMAAWEEAGTIRAQLLPGGSPVALSRAEAAQVTLAKGTGRVYAAWAEQAGRFRHIVVARLETDSGTPTVVHAQPVEAGEPTEGQSWPALAVAGDGSVTVAWEDRRERHTVPMASHGPDGRDFALPVHLTDLKPGGGAASTLGLGAGTGAMRPTLTAWNEQGVAAAWLDKRDFLSGYDVYAALDDGSHRFGRNLQVQDSFGDNMAQWHAKIVGDASGRLLALWDDARDGTSDVWLSAWNGTALGFAVAVPAAAGPGTQSDPSATLDSLGRLHLVWLDRGDGQSAARIRYVRGEWH